MNRLKWVRVSGLPEKKVLVSRFLKHSFSEEGSSGFILDKAVGDIVSAKYVEKVTYIDVMEDPYGKKIEQEIISFKTLYFNVYINSSVIEMINPDLRVSKGFYALLALSSQFSIQLDPVVIEPLTWSEEIISGSTHDFYVEQVEFEPHLTKGGVYVKLAASGKDSIVSQCKSLLAVEHPVAKKIKLRSRVLSGYSIEAKSSGIVIMSSKLPVEDAELVRKVSCGCYL